MPVNTKNSNSKNNKKANNNSVEKLVGGNDTTHVLETQQETHVQETHVQETHVQEPHVQESHEATVQESHEATVQDTTTQEAQLGGTTKGKGKGKGKQTKGKTTESLEVTEVTESLNSVKVDDTLAVQTAGGNKKKATKKKSSQKAVELKITNLIEETKEPKTQKGKKSKAVVKQTKTTKKLLETDVDEDGVEKNERGVRSFKVQLPSDELFVGRFTGLTPYQAANKALSKYFRENKTIKTEITFSIKESTRGSKRSTYVYSGKREKLGTPVRYSINGPDGVAREIVKEYKNKLTKVKKSESKEMLLSV